MIRILHFADAHIDMAAQGRRDPQSGLPIRVLDFLKALDTIVDTAISERVDLVLFAGDAYRDRTPAPTYQREWGKRMMRLSRAGIPTLLLVGNHDLSPAYGRAHSLQEYETLEVPHVRAVSKPCLLRPEDLDGLPLQILALPWIYRSGMLAVQGMSNADTSAVYAHLEDQLAQLVEGWLKEVDPDLPTVLAAHASVQGAQYGWERNVMLGQDLVLSGSLVRNRGLDYVALGHIHKAQDVNEGGQPPVVYPGSIERVDFGEAAEEKFFVIAELEKDQATRVDWRPLHGRRFIDRRVEIRNADELEDRLAAALPDPEELCDAMVRLTLIYPRELESLIDEHALRARAEPALEFHLVRKPQQDPRLRLPEDQTMANLSPLELLELYKRAVTSQPPQGFEDIQRMAADIVATVEGLETAAQAAPGEAEG
jgi:exonuclease SbcD